MVKVSSMLAVPSEPLVLLGNQPIVSFRFGQVPGSNEVRKVGSQFPKHLVPPGFPSVNHVRFVHHEIYITSPSVLVNRKKKKMFCPEVKPSRLLLPQS